MNFRAVIAVVIQSRVQERYEYWDRQKPQSCAVEIMAVLQIVEGHCSITISNENTQEMVS